MRWSLALQPYSFTVQHRKGSSNANADALSRLPCGSDNPTDSPMESSETREGGRGVTEQKDRSHPTELKT